jgi:hypothetical protein
LPLSNEDLRLVGDDVVRVTLTGGIMKNVSSFLVSLPYVVVDSHLHMTIDKSRGSSRDRLEHDIADSLCCSRFNFHHWLFANPYSFRYRKEPRACMLSSFTLMHNKRVGKVFEANTLSMNSLTTNTHLTTHHATPLWPSNSIGGRGGGRITSCEQHTTARAPQPCPSFCGHTRWICSRIFAAQNPCMCKLFTPICVAR